MVGQLSEDGNWKWDGENWVPIDAGASVAAPDNGIGIPEKSMNENPQFVEAATPIAPISEQEIEDATQGSTTLKDEEEIVNESKLFTQVVSVMIMIMAAGAGMMSQQLTDVEAEASSYEVDSQNKVAEARGLESTENQLLLKEEILLTEAKSQVVASQTQLQKLSTTSAKLNASIDEYNANNIEKEVYGFLLDGASHFWYSSWDEEDGLLEFCKNEHSQCSMEVLPSSEMQFTLRLTISEGDDMVFNEYYEALFDVEFDSSLQNEHAYSVNPVISIFPALDSELNEIPGEPEVVMLEIPLFFEDSYIDWENWDWLGDIPYVQIIDEFGNYIGDNPFNESLGFSGLVDNRSYQVDMLQYELETLDTTLFNIEWSIDANTDNWLMYNAEANLNSNLASFYYALDDWTNYTVHDDLRIHFEGLEQAAINNVNENQTLRETEKANRAEVAQHHTDAEKELSDANKVYDKIEEKYEGENTELLNEISKLEGLILETEDITKDFELSNSMKDGLLDQSDAYKRNLIDPETADFYSEDERRDYVIETHAASVSAYSASVGYQEQAEETRLKTNELASAIMFISTATVLCGIVSATLKKDNRGNRMMVLALIGVAVVLFGLGATRFLMT